MFYSSPACCVPLRFEPGKMEQVEIRGFGKFHSEGEIDQLSVVPERVKLILSLSLASVVLCLV